VVAKQARNAYPLDFNWVRWFAATHRWTLAAVLLVLAAVVVDGLRSRSASRPAGDGEQHQG
jgi:hypothetical protein